MSEQQESCESGENTPEIGGAFSPQHLIAGGSSPSPVHKKHTGEQLPMQSPEEKPAANDFANNSLNDCAHDSKVHEKVDDHFTHAHNAKPPLATDSSSLKNFNEDGFVCFKAESDLTKENVVEMCLEDHVLQSLRALSNSAFLCGVRSLRRLVMQCNNNKDGCTLFLIMIRTCFVEHAFEQKSPSEWKRVLQEQDSYWRSVNTNGVTVRITHVSLQVLDEDDSCLDVSELLNEKWCRRVREGKRKFQLPLVQNSHYFFDFADLHIPEYFYSPSFRKPEMINFLLSFSSDVSALNAAEHAETAQSTAVTALGNESPQKSPAAASTIGASHPKLTTAQSETTGAVVSPAKSTAAQPQTPTSNGSPDAETRQTPIPKGTPPQRLRRSNYSHANPSKRQKRHRNAHAQVSPVASKDEDGDKSNENNKISDANKDEDGDNDNSNNEDDNNFDANDDDNSSSPSAKSATSSNVNDETAQFKQSSDPIGAKDESKEGVASLDVEDASNSLAVAIPVDEQPPGIAAGSNASGKNVVVTTPLDEQQSAGSNAMDVDGEGDGLENKEDDAVDVDNDNDSEIDVDADYIRLKEQHADDPAWTELSTRLNKKEELANKQLKGLAAFTKSHQHNILDTPLSTDVWEPTTDPKYTALAITVHEIEESEEKYDRESMRLGLQMYKAAMTVAENLPDGRKRKGRGNFLTVESLASKLKCKKSTIERLRAWGNKLLKFPILMQVVEDKVYAPISLRMSREFSVDIIQDIVPFMERSMKTETRLVETMTLM